MMQAEVCRRVRDEALEEAARVVEQGHHLFDIGARLRARKASPWAPPTSPAVLRELGVDDEPRYW